MAMKEIETNRDLSLSLIGFLDDNIRMHGRKVHGYPVFGGQGDLEDILKKKGIKKLIVSFRENGFEKKREIEKLCFRLGLDIDVNQMKLIIS